MASKRNKAQRRKQKNKRKQVQDWNRLNSESTLRSIVASIKPPRLNLIPIFVDDFDQERALGAFGVLPSNFVMDTDNAKQDWISVQSFVKNFNDEYNEIFSLADEQKQVHHFQNLVKAHKEICDSGVWTKPLKQSALLLGKVVERSVIEKQLTPREGAKALFLFKHLVALHNNLE